MIIQFTGAQSTGKTSVSQALTQHHAFVAQREIARDVYDQGFPINSGGTNFSQSYMDLLLLQRFMRSREQCWQNIVFDRSFICCYAYTRLINAAPILLNTTLELIQQTSQHPYAAYTFYFPTADSPVSFMKDGVREQKSRHIVDTYVREALKISQIPFYTMPNKSVEDRMNFIIDIVFRRHA